MAISLGLAVASWPVLARSAGLISRLAAGELLGWIVQPTVWVFAFVSWKTVHDDVKSGYAADLYLSAISRETLLRTRLFPVVVFLALVNCLTSFAIPLMTIMPLISNPAVTWSDFFGSIFAIFPKILADSVMVGALIPATVWSVLILSGSWRNSPAVTAPSALLSAMLLWAVSKGTVGLVTHVYWLTGFMPNTWLNSATSRPGQVWRMFLINGWTGGVRVLVGAVVLWGLYRFLVRRLDDLLRND